MNTAIVTWITYKNYGSFLQGYALQSALNQMGYENTIISDKEIVQTIHNECESICKEQVKQKDKESVLIRLLRLFRNPRRIPLVAIARYNRQAYEYPYVQSRKKFDEFRAESLNVMEVNSCGDYVTLNQWYDTFICGSDQIWSTVNRLCPFYFLDFVEKRKIAYAPSLGTVNISAEKAEKLKALVRDFHALSVRELHSAVQLSQLTGRTVNWVCDPTLLHGKDFWSSFSSQAAVCKKKYILCYFLEDKKWYFENAKKIAEHLHVPIVLLPSRYEFLGNENTVRKAVGPREFVSWIKNAEYVLTDSYHGSIFSLIFEKQFLYFKRFRDSDRNSQNLRIQSLFDYLDISFVIVSELERYNLDTYLDYEKIGKRIAEHRMSSWKYLQTSMQNDSNV